MSTHPHHHCGHIGLMVPILVIVALNLLGYALANLGSSVVKSCQQRHVANLIEAAEQDPSRHIITEKGGIMRTSDDRQLYFMVGFALSPDSLILSSLRLCGIQHIDTIAQFIIVGDILREIYAHDPGIDNQYLYQDVHGIKWDNKVASFVVSDSASATYSCRGIDYCSPIHIQIDSLSFCGKVFWLSP